MDLLASSALLSAKVIKLLNKRLGSGGTAAPGLLSTYIDKNILKKLASKLETTILITGTNGKTTTSRILGNFLDYKKINYIHNRHGSNLERGLISAFIEKTNLLGNFQAKIGIFEVDEAALRVVINKTAPNVLTITNLFRDQLDRYGEIDNIKKLWLEVVANLDQNSTLVLNADDPTVASLGREANCQVVYFGIEDKKAALSQTPSAVDSIKCPRCYSDLKYTAYFSSHQGIYNCPNCKFTRPNLDVAAKNIKLEELESEFTLEDKSGFNFNLEAKLPGLYNIYNCLASYATLKASRFELDIFPLIMKEFKPVFGRTEKLFVDGRNIIVALAKNPTGFNEIIRTFLSKKDQTVLIAINDLIADGRDVSWLWDVDFESVADKENRYFLSGIRASDMILRLKYAEIKNTEIVEPINEALEAALATIPQNDTLLIIPTYTAMLELKRIFAKKDISGHFWEN